MKVGVKKLRVPWLPDSENHMILWLLVLTQSQHVMDRQTDRQTDSLCLQMSHSNTAECDNNYTALQKQGSVIV